jgi:methionine-rich copper-binding protein CopC
MASDYTWNFTTTGDADPPNVSSTSPPNGGAGVSINRTITATFSEAMQSSTMNANTFTVSDGIGNISGTVSYNDKTATFTPSSNLSSYTAYTARITTGVKDLAGNAMESLYTWSFMTTGDVDNTAPAVSSTSPANGAAGVDVSSTITATFSEELDATTITTDTFTVNDGSRYIRGTVSYSGTTATFTPSGNLPSYTTYTARITTEARDLVGNAVASDYTWSFTTTGDFAVPTIRSTSPANGTAGVDVGSIITATFSEEMDASTITADTFTVNDGNSNVSGTVSYGDKIATFTPSDNLAYFTTYTATISTGVMDSAENALSSPYTWSFTTESAPMVTPTITLMATATPTPTPAETGAIETWVTDAVTGKGINDATVTLDTDQLTTANAECDQDGFCPFRDLAAGDYTVTASASGYTSETQAATVTGDGTTVVTFALSAVPIQTPTPVLCDAEKIEASPEEIKLQKKKKATVLLSIICEDGVTPVIGETVTARVKTGKDRVRVSPSIAVTDDNGQAVFKIAAKNTTGKVRIQFKTNNSREVVKVKVVK